MSGLRSVSAADPAFTPFELVAIGCSAGGLAPLSTLLSSLSRDFPIPVVVVQHLSATLPSQLPEVLNFRSALPCRWAEPGERPRRGTVLVAPPGTNLVLAENGSLARQPGPKPRLGWPSVDLFLESAARALGPRAIAIVLSGMMHDGAKGIAAVRRAGGATMVQHPRSAQFPEMPSAAVDLGRADLLMPPATIALALDILGEAGVR
ncbi:chemotaxis protein CheB [Muricoccus radiodurans]|uniref:chemotaxis protein CheB n=1 Tax=Muricoccus radiodurans TaxID=2231721 RepID=UPI003CE9A75D